MCTHTCACATGLSVVVGYRVFFTRAHKHAQKTVAVVTKSCCIAYFTMTTMGGGWGERLQANMIIQTSAYLGEIIISDSHYTKMDCFHVQQTYKLYVYVSQKHDFDDDAHVRVYTRGNPVLNVFSNRSDGY